MRIPRIARPTADKVAKPEPPPSSKRPKRATDELDTAIGARIRAARLAAKMSQMVLGQAVDISHQQVQKYEFGKDRVSASMLQRIAAVLGVHPGSFFDDNALVLGNLSAEAKAPEIATRAAQRGTVI